MEGLQELRSEPVGRLRLNVPLLAARFVLPRYVAPFIEQYPGITVEVTAEERFVDIVAEGYDAGIRFEKRLEQDMVALPVGPRSMRIALGPDCRAISRAISGAR